MWLKKKRLKIAVNSRKKISFMVSIFGIWRLNFIVLFKVVWFSIFDQFWCIMTFNIFAGNLYSRNISTPYLVDVNFKCSSTPKIFK